MAVVIDKNRCDGCQECEAICPTGVIRVLSGKAWADPARCVACGACVRECPAGAITLPKEDIRNGK